MSPGTPARYADRSAAGRALAARLGRLGDGADVVVLALPRGGVPVAAPVAAALGAPLDVLVVRKLGLPAQPELAMGAVAEVGDTVVVDRNDDVLARAGVTEEVFDAVLRRETAVLLDRVASYRAGRPPTAVAGRLVVIVDDGLATGSTMRAAVGAVRRQRPGRVVVAVPVGAPQTCEALRQVADEVVCLHAPRRFAAVGQAYDDFRPTSDDEVRRALR